MGAETDSCCCCCWCCWGIETGGIWSGARLWGNWSGLGRECVRSNRPHLLHSCQAQVSHYIMSAEQQTSEMIGEAGNSNRDWDLPLCPG